MKRTTYKQHRFLLLCLLAAILPFAALSAQDKKPLDPQQVRTTLAKYGNEISELSGLLPAGWEITRMAEGICDTTQSNRWGIFNSPLLTLTLAFVSDTAKRELELQFYPATVYPKIHSIPQRSVLISDFTKYPSFISCGKDYCVYVCGNTRISHFKFSHALQSGSAQSLYPPEYKPMTELISTLFPYSELRFSSFINLNDKLPDQQRIRAELAKYGDKIARLPELLPTGWHVVGVDERLCDTTSGDIQEIFNNPLARITLYSDVSERQIDMRLYPTSMYRKMIPVVSRLAKERDFYHYPEYLASGDKYCVLVRGDVIIWNHEIAISTASTAGNTWIDELRHPKEYIPVIDMLAAIFPHRESDSLYIPGRAPVEPKK